MVKTNEPQLETLWNKDYILFLVVNTVAFISFQILVPIVPLYGLSFTTSESMIGVLASSVAIAALFSRPFSGAIADRYDSNRIIFLTQIGTAIVIVLYVIAPSIEVLIAIRLIQGLLFGLCSTVIFTAAIRTIPEAIMGKGIGILTVTGIASQAIAPIVGLWIVEKWDYTGLFTFTGSIALVAAAIAFFTKVGKAASKTMASKSEHFSFKDLFAVESAGFVVLVIIMAATMALPVNFIVLYANTRGIPNIGLYFTINAIAVILMRVFGSGLIDKYSYRQILPLSAAFCAAGLAIIGASYSFPPLCIAAVLLGAGFGLSAPTILTNMIRSVRPERIGVTSATYYFGLDFAYVAGPIAMGFIAETSGYSTGFFIFVIPTIMAIPLTFLFSRKRQETQQTPDIK